MTNKTALKQKANVDISNDNDDLLMEKIASFFNDPKSMELLAIDPDKAIANFGLDPKDVYRALRNPAKLSVFKKVQ